MKKSRIFMASGACILAITSFFATKANKKFADQLSTVKASDGIYLYQTGALDKFATVHAAGVEAYMVLYTAGNSSPIKSGDLTTAVASSSNVTVHINPTGF
jgi:hypothetical protein